LHFFLRPPVLELLDIVRQIISSLPQRTPRKYKEERLLFVFSSVSSVVKDQRSAHD
jgi:hypothetical protein